MSGSASAPLAADAERPLDPPAGIRWPLLLVAGTVLALFSVAFLRTAWVADDAFITFRVIDNALHGLGLVWNPGERVQVFTHPLWLGLLLPAVSVLGDPYAASLVVSYALLLITLALVLRTIPRWNVANALVLLALLWSRAFVDYASSGLENPLTHVLVAAWVAIWLADLEAERRTLALGLVASGLFLSRPDAVVLIAPCFAAQLWQVRRGGRAQLVACALGLLPAIAWVAFSVFYYGAPVPNTALAKVDAGGSLERAQQAIAYIGWTIENDAVTAALLLAGVLTGLLAKQRKLRPLGAGLLLWIAYLAYVGADYMGGRFFSAAALLAAAIVAVELARSHSRIVALAVAAPLALQAGVLAKTLASPADYANPQLSPAGIADERGYYYPALGLLPAAQRGTWYAHGWLLQGTVLRDRAEGWFTRCAIGMSGYAAGPNVRWVDPLALAEPFLARLPPRTNARVGHYERALPPGYLESVLTGENAIVDPSLRALYDDVRSATRAPLFSTDRIGAVWRLNTGFHAHAADRFDRDAIGLPGEPVQSTSPFTCYGIPYGADGTWRLEGSPARALRVVVRPR